MKRKHLSLAVAALLLVFAVGCEQMDEELDPVETNELTGSWTYQPASASDTTLQYMVFDESGLYSRLEISWNRLHLREDGYYTIDGQHLVLSEGLNRYGINEDRLWISSAPADTLFFERSAMPVSPDQWQIDLNLVGTHPINLDRFQGSLLEYDGENFWAYSFSSSQLQLVKFSLDGDSLSSIPSPNFFTFAYGGGSLWLLNNDDIIQVDPETGATIAQIALDDNIFAISMAYDEGTLWISGYGEMWHVDLASGEILSYREIRTVFFEELTIHNGHLLAMTNDFIVEVDKVTGLFINTYKLPEIPESSGFFSMASDGNHLFAVHRTFTMVEYKLYEMMIP